MGDFFTIRVHPGVPKGTAYIVPDQDPGETDEDYLERLQKEAVVLKFGGQEVDRGHP